MERPIKKFALPWVIVTLYNKKDSLYKQVRFALGNWNSRAKLSISEPHISVVLPWVIKFKCIKNRDEIYETIGKLLVERQASKTTSNEASSADDLKKYKDLLDTGVISQEEFDAKKKQILGV